MRKRLYFVILCLGVAIVVWALIPYNREPKDAASLGKALFFDPILSGDSSVSCASCHKPAFAFADTSALSVGVFHRKGNRNTPSVMNVDQQSSFFWDGRAATLEDQALIPIANPVEMNLPVAIAVHRLEKSDLYASAFLRVYDSKPSAKNLSAALAAFQRSLETINTPFDLWRRNDREDAMSASAKRGYALFNGKARCVTCHFGTNFSTGEFRNIGLYDGVHFIDSGRAAITGNRADLGKFKVGSLRNISLTAPYMHNGAFRTLREVIDYYDDPDKVVAHPVNRDPLLSTPLHLSESEKTDLEDFLKSLTDPGARRG